MGKIRITDVDLEDINDDILEEEFKSKAPKKTTAVSAKLVKLNEVWLQNEYSIDIHKVKEDFGCPDPISQFDLYCGDTVVILDKNHNLFKKTDLTREQLIERYRDSLERGKPYEQKHKQKPKQSGETTETPIAETTESPKIRTVRTLHGVKTTSKNK